MYEDVIVSDQKPGSTRDYAHLKRMIKEAGLLKRQPVFYLLKLLLLLALCAASVCFLIVVKNFWLQLLNAAFLAFVSTQFGLLGHDAGHRQIFYTTWKNDVISLIAGNLFVGISHEWWLNRHNAHHSHPNQCDLDPDISIPIIAFAPGDLLRQGKFVRFVMKYQAYFFFPVLMLASLEMQRNSIQFLCQEKVKYGIVERVLLSLHFIGYFVLLLSCMPVWQVVIFAFVHHILSGVYMGSIFAPNHKGMPVLDVQSSLDFLQRQVITSRNVYAHPITDFWYGGLNYQIEHHLFPAMPRRHLRKAQRIVKAFCLDHEIPYYETNILQSYCETLQALHEMSAPLRIAENIS